MKPDVRATYRGGNHGLGVWGGAVCAFNTEAAGRVSGVQPTHLGTNRVPKTKNDLAVPG